MAKRKKSKIIASKADQGTVETRRRLTSDPLLSADIEPHRLQAALAIRAALEDGLGAPSLDMVRIGMGGGASNSERSFIPTTPRNIEHRGYHQKWVVACKAADLEHHIVELYALGHSIRQIAAHVHLRRTRCADIINAGLDLYADLRGYRRHTTNRSRLAVWEAEQQTILDPEVPVFVMPPKAALRHRAIRNDQNNPGGNT